MDIIMKGEGHNLGVDNVVVSGYKNMLVRASMPL